MLHVGDVDKSVAKLRNCLNSTSELFENRFRVVFLCYIAGNSELLPIRNKEKRSDTDTKKPNRTANIATNERNKTKLALLFCSECRLIFEVYLKYTNKRAK